MSDYEIEGLSVPGEEVSSLRHDEGFLTRNHQCMDN